MFKSIAHTSLIRFSSTVLNFLIAVLISRYAGAKVKGETTLIITNITFIQLICSFIGGASLVYLLPRIRFSKLVIPSYIWTLIVCSGVYIFFRFFHVFPFKIAAHTCILALLFSLISIHGTVLLAKQQIQKFNLIYLLPVVFNFIFLGFALFYLHMQGTRAYLLSLYISYSLTFVLSLFFCFKYFEFESLATYFDEIDETLKFGIAFQLIELFQVLNARFYFYLLHHLQDANDLGYYSIGVALVEVAWVLSRAIFLVHFSLFSKTNFVGDKVDSILHLMKIAVLVSCIYLAFISLLPIEFYAWVFGDQFKYVKYLMKWLIPGAIVYNIYLCIQSYYLSSGQYGKLLFANLSGFVVEITFCYLLIPDRYFSGASAGASLGFICSSLLMLIFFMSDTQTAFKKLLPQKSDILFIHKILNHYKVLK